VRQQARDTRAEKARLRLRLLTAIQDQVGKKNNALSTGKTRARILRNLLQIGASNYPDRIATLKKEMKALTDTVVLGVKRYNEANGAFS
jgi:hypothetical protein